MADAAHFGGLVLCQWLMSQVASPVMLFGLRKLFDLFSVLLASQLHLHILGEKCKDKMSMSHFNDESKKWYCMLLTEISVLIPNFYLDQ